MAAINVTSASGDLFDLAQGDGQLVRNSAGIPYVVAQNDSDNNICVYRGGSSFYSNSLGGSQLSLYGGGGVGQSFTGDGTDVTEVAFRLQKIGSPTGNATIALYAESGGLPSGSALVSKTLDVSTLSTTTGFTIVRFDTPYTTTGSTTYFATIAYSGGDASNCIRSSYYTGDIAPGYRVVYSGASWSSETGQDVAVVVLRDGGADIDTFIEMDYVGTNKPSVTDIAAVSAAIDANDYIHISYFDPGQGKSTPLNYIRFRADGTNDDWFEAAATVIADIGEAPTATLLSTAIAVDRNNVPHIAYNEYPKLGGTSTYVLAYINKIGGSWNTQVYIDYNAGVHCYYLSLDFNFNGYPIVSYYRGASQTWAAVGNLINPTAFTTASIGNSGGNTSILVDHEGSVWVAWFYGTVGYLRKNLFTASWSTWVSQDTVSGLASSNSISLDIVGTDLYFFYLDSNYDVSYNVWDGSSWSGKTVLDTGTYAGVRAKWSLYHNRDSNGFLRFIDSYLDYANWSIILNNTDTACGQSFVGDGRKISGVSFMYDTGGSPSGNSYARLYAASGGVPTGSPLVSSGATALSSVSTDRVIVYDFSIPYQLTQGNNYVIVFEFASGTASDYVRVFGSANLGHSGTASKYSGSWSTDSALDLIFVLLTDTPAQELSYISIDSTSDILFNTLSLAAAPTGYTLTVTGATASVTGASVTLRSDKLLTATGATANITGGTVTLTKTRRLTVTGATANATGGSVGLYKRSLLTASGAVSNVTGGSVTLTRRYTLSATGELVSATGGLVNLLRGFSLTASGAIANATGNSVTLRHDRLLQITGATANVTGGTVNLVRNYAIVASGSIINTTGGLVTLTYTAPNVYTLTVTGASALVTGGLVAMSRTYNLGISGSSISIIGGEINISYVRKLLATGAVIPVTGSQVNLLFNRRLAIAKGTTSVTGGSTSLLFNRRLAVTGSSANATGGSVTLLFNRSLQATGAIINTTGGVVDLIYSASPVVYTLVVTGALASLTGGSINLRHDRLLSATGAVSSILGGSTDLRYDRAIQVTGSPVNTTGGLVDLRAKRILTATGQTASVLGGSVGLYQNRRLTVTGSPIDITGDAVSLFWNHVLQAVAGVIQVSGGVVNTLYSGEVFFVVSGEVDIRTIASGLIDIRLNADGNVEIRTIATGSAEL